MGYIFDKMVVQCRFERVVLLFLVFGEPGFIVRVHNRGERRLLQCWPAVCLGCIRAKKCYFGKLDEQKSPGEVISGVVPHPSIDALMDPVRAQGTSTLSSDLFTAPEPQGHC